MRFLVEVQGDGHGVRHEIKVNNKKLWEDAVIRRLEELATYVNGQSGELLLQLHYGYNFSRKEDPNTDHKKYWGRLIANRHAEPGSVPTIAVEFDYLICCGGVSDKCRDTYLGKILYRAR